MVYNFPKDAPSIVKEFIKITDNDEILEFAKKIVKDGNSLRYIIRMGHGSYLYPKHFLALLKVYGIKLIDKIYCQIVISMFLTYSNDQTVLDYIIGSERVPAFLSLFSAVQNSSFMCSRSNFEIILNNRFICAMENIPYIKKPSPCYSTKNKKIEVFDFFQYINVVTSNIADFNLITTLNYYDIYIQYINNGFIPSEQLFYDLISNINISYKCGILTTGYNFNCKNEIIYFKEPYKIIDHCAKTYGYSVNVKKIDIIKNNKGKDIDFSRLFKYCINIDYDYAIECFKNGIYINIRLPELNLLTFDNVFYDIYYRNCILDITNKNIHAKTLHKRSNILVSQLCNDQITLREKFKYVSLENINNYINKHKGLIIDQYCINNAYKFNNRSVITECMTKKIYPTNDILRSYFKICAKKSSLDKITHIIFNMFPLLDDNTLNSKIDKKLI